MPPTKAKLVVVQKRKLFKSEGRTTTVNYHRVREDGQIPFHVVKEMHRSNLWASDWLKRYDTGNDVKSINV